MTGETGGVARPEADRGRVAANYAHTFLFHAHRGVLDCDDKYVVFGNDGYDDPNGWPRREVEFLRERLRALELKESAFGTSDDGYSWALVIDNYGRLDAEAELYKALYTAHFRAAGKGPAEARRLAEELAEDSGK